MRGRARVGQVARHLVAPGAVVLLVTGAVTAEAATPVEPWGDVTSLVTLSSAGEQANRRSYADTDVSASGRFVVFESSATNLVAGDTNGSPDIFVRDREAGTTERVSVGPEGAQAELGGSGPGISANGRFVVFISSSPDLVRRDTNEQQDVFLHDRKRDLTRRMSIGANGAEGDSFSSTAAISGDGRTVAFESDATNLVPGDTNRWTDVFVRDRREHTTRRVSVSGSEQQGNGRSAVPVVSRDGRYIEFKSGATNLVPGDTNAFDDVFVRDQEAGSTDRVNLTYEGEQADHGGEFSSTIPLSISSDGRFVYFETDSANLVADDGNGLNDGFVRDRVAATTTRVTLDFEDEELFGAVGGGDMSDDGNLVVFWSLPDFVVPGDTNNASDIFVRNIARGTTRPVSVTNADGRPNGEATAGAMSPNGRHISFQSTASNVVAGDTNRVSDVFVRDRLR